MKTRNCVATIIGTILLIPAVAMATPPNKSNPCWDKGTCGKSMEAPAEKPKKKAPAKKIHRTTVQGWAAFNKIVKAQKLKVLNKVKVAGGTNVASRKMVKKGKNGWNPITVYHYVQH